MQSWWMRMTDGAAELERRDAPVPAARAGAAAACACTPRR